ncbi:MAG TPA: hypothetical protein VFO18_15000 [Methylomirabilota bacterium]|nr:hypothetical protein [Methylomirabilota bacterium]
MRRSRPVAGLLALVALASPGVARAQTPQLHGADTVLVAPTVTIIWGVLSDPKQEQPLAIARVINTSRSYEFVTLVAVNPFSGRRAVVADGVALNDQVDLRSPRGSYADYPRREFHLYRTAADLRVKRPALTVYYLGLPDTTPELRSQTALEAWFSLALNRRR